MNAASASPLTFPTRASTRGISVVDVDVKSSEVLGLPFYALDFHGEVKAANRPRGIGLGRDTLQRSSDRACKGVTV